MYLSSVDEGGTAVAGAGRMRMRWGCDGTELADTGCKGGGTGFIPEAGGWLRTVFIYQAPGGNRSGKRNDTS